MVKKAFFKTVYRSLFHNKGRFLANFLVVFLSLTLTSGLGAMPSEFVKSFSKNYSEGYVQDVNIKFLKEIDQSSLGIFMDLDELEKAEPYSSIDTEYNSSYARLYWRDFNGDQISLPRLLEGDLPTKSNEILAEASSLNRANYKIGDVVTLDLSTLLPNETKEQQFVVSGIVKSPLYNSVAKERAFVEKEDYLNSIFYFDKTAFENGYEEVPTTDVYVRFAMEHNYFSSSYQEEVDEWANAIRAFLKDSVNVMTLEENTSYALFKNYNEKITKIAFVFPLFFIALCALINLLTITRLIKDERSSIGCYRSLGISKGAIIGKYACLSFLSVSLGAILGYIVGTPFLPKVVLPAYSAVFVMQDYVPSFYNLTGLIVALSTILLSLLISIVYSSFYLKETPASLLKEKAPAAGKKILLERFPSLWNKISFSFKNSFRNIFRHKKNSFLTGLSILGSTILILIGFALLDVSTALQNDEIYANVASSMGFISFVIILFALLMAITVVYSLTNSNIQDRTRELATLKVLGYHTSECSLYTFREIMILSLFASALALPIGAGLITWVFDYLSFGSIGDVRWYSYLSSFLIINLSTILTNFLLYHRVKSIDMNASLKSID